MDFSTICSIPVFYDLHLLGKEIDEWEEKDKRKLIEYNRKIIEEYDREEEQRLSNEINNLKVIK